MTSRRTKLRLLFGSLALGLSLAAACSLNPQPLPPGIQSAAGPNGTEDAAGTPPTTGGSMSDTDATPNTPLGDAGAVPPDNSDGGVDSGTALEGGPADGATDATDGSFEGSADAGDGGG